MSGCSTQLASSGLIGNPVSLVPTFSPVPVPDPGIALPGGTFSGPPVLDPGIGVTYCCFLWQPVAARLRIKPRVNNLADWVSFIFFLSWIGRVYLAQLGCDCELLPGIRETSFTCFVGTSS